MASNLTNKEWLETLYGALNTLDDMYNQVIEEIKNDNYQVALNCIFTMADFFTWITWVYERDPQFHSTFGKMNVFYRYENLIEVNKNLFLKDMNRGIPDHMYISRGEDIKWRQIESENNGNNK